MIPEFNDDGYLPPGIHQARLDEVAARFGQSSDLRQVQMESLLWCAELARRAGIDRIIVNGSFVTDKLEPNGVDCVLLVGPRAPHDLDAELELLNVLPFINMELVNQEAFDQFTQRTKMEITPTRGCCHPMLSQSTASTRARLW